MSETIQNWLANRLGIIVDVESESFLQMVQNGCLIAKLLYTNGLIGEEQLKLIENTSDVKTAFDRVAIWLKNVDDETKSAIAGGDLFASINLLYKLYLNLKDKDKLHFISKQVQVECLRPCVTRFELTPIPETTSDSFVLKPNPLSKPLQDYVHVIHWYKAKHFKLISKCEKSIREYETHALNNTHPPGDLCTFDARNYILGLIESEPEFAHEDYETLLAQARAVVTPFKPDVKVARRIVADLQKKRRRRAQQIAAKVQKERVLMEELWQKNSLRIKLKADLVVSEKVLRQACFEKQITTRMYEVREQKNVIANERGVIDDEVKQKSDGLILEEAFFKAKDVDDGKRRCHTERKKAIHLHNRLHEEMQRLKRTKRHDFTYRIVEDIVDFAVYEAEYFKHFAQVLYHHETAGDGIYQRLKTEMAAMFKASESIFDSVRDSLLAAMVEGKGEDGVNEEYFLNYHRYDRPWEVAKHAPSFTEKLDEMRSGANILGHVVFRLLLAKYPKPPPVETPVFPTNVDFGVCVDNLNDPIAVISLSKLLAKKGVKVIRLEEAINNCLDAYKSHEQVASLQFVKETDEALKSLRLKTAESRSSRESPLEIQEQQEVQTPMELRLSPKAELGRLVYEILSLGESLNDKLLAKIFVEYLKDQEDIGGWVLVNYPQNLEQAAILEETLTGDSVPCKHKSLETGSSRSSQSCVNCTCFDGVKAIRVEDIADLEFRHVPQNTAFDDVNAKSRISKLLTNPDPPPPEADGRRTYLKAYVRIETCDDCNESLLDEFYREQGVLRVFHCESYDPSTIQRLADLIIQESVPAETPLQVLGDGFEASETREVDEEKTPVEDLSEAKGKTKKVKASREKSRGDRETQRPGEALRMYVDVSIPEALQIALASLWEAVERTYVNSMKHLFFQFRILWEQFVPYMNSVRVYMNDFIARPDDVQQLLHDFHVAFNKIPADMRNDDEVKAELHHRVCEFKEELWERCFKRMQEAEDERKMIINRNWVTRQACELTDTYVRQLQLEVRRCGNTMQLLNDYYTGMITKMVSEEPVFEEACVTSFSKTREFEAYSAYVTRGVVKGTTSPFERTINDNFGASTAATDAYQKRSFDLVEKMEKLFLPKSKKTQSGDGKGKGKLPKFTGPEEDVKQVGPQLIDEWKSVISGEALRTRCRLTVIKSNVAAKVAPQGIVPYTGMIFDDIKRDILERYEKEIKSVQHACDVFSRAIEEETALQPQLVLDGYDFNIRADVLMYADSLPGPETPAPEQPPPGGTFSVKQLSELVDFLLETAPSGILSEREFTYLLQNLARRTLEDGKDPVVPASWVNQDLNLVSSYYFGETEVVDWKDFVVYNLCLDFPTERELIETRTEFRYRDVDSNECVYDYQYYEVKFWFERTDSMSKRIKELLYKMYKTDEGTVNYTALLLAFCKDRNPILGVAKALELALGVYVCWQSDAGEAFTDKLRNRRKLEAQELESRDRMIQEIVEDLTGFGTFPTESGATMSYLKEIYHESYWKDLDEPRASFHGKKPRVLFEEGLQTESEGEYGPAKLYFLPFEALLNVLMAAMPWHSTAQNIGDASLRQKVEIAYETCRCSEFDNQVFAHEFLNSKLFRELLEGIYKFTAKHPREICT